MGMLRGYLFLLMAVVDGSKDVRDRPEVLEQRAVDFDFDLLEDSEWIRETVRPQVRPRSMVPKIPFPPARPSQLNLQAICLNGSRRPRYPKQTLPHTGFGYLHRQAHTINQLESWFTTCCSSVSEDEQKLCCVQQAWKESLSDFCENEFMIKTTHYHCCKKKEYEKWRCFEEQASDRSYQASGDESWSDIQAPTFNFDSSACQKANGLRANISFPLGRPNSANIGAICDNHKQRPRYLSKCLPSNYDWLARQIKATNGLEKGISHCCEQKNKQGCAEKKWKKMVVMFCKAEKAANATQFDCCEKEREEEQYDCFAAAAPNPDYILADDGGSPSQTHSNLDMFCDLRQRPVTFPVDFLTHLCCPLPKKKRLACFKTELYTRQDQLCDTSREYPILRCCSKEGKSRTKCLTKMLMQNIRNASVISRNKCPISS